MTMPLLLLTSLNAAKLTHEERVRDACADAQDAGAGGADEGAHGHVGVGRAALLAVEAFPVGGPTGHLAQQLQVLLFLFALHTRRHDGNQSASLPSVSPPLHREHRRSSCPVCVLQRAKKHKLPAPS